MKYPGRKFAFDILQDCGLSSYFKNCMFFFSTGSWPEKRRKPLGQHLQLKPTDETRMLKCNILFNISLLFYFLLIFWYLFRREWSRTKWFTCVQIFENVFEVSRCVILRSPGGDENIFPPIRSTCIHKFLCNSGLASTPAFVVLCDTPPFNLRCLWAFAKGSNQSADFLFQLVPLGYNFFSKHIHKTDHPFVWMSRTIVIKDRDLSYS